MVKLIHHPTLIYILKMSDYIHLAQLPVRFWDTFSGDESKIFSKHTNFVESGANRMMKYTSIALAFLPFLATAKLGEHGQGNRHLQAEIPIVKVGEEPATPLGRCEGDCDGDGECGSGLKCFQRTEAFKAVPGCSGGAQDSSLFDYCVRNSDNFPALTKLGANPGVPLERCEGDCDSDSDCASSDLFCFPVGEAKTFVPGCRGGQSDTSLFDYCIRRVDAPPGVAPPTAPTADPSPDPTPDPTPPPASTPTPDPTPAPVSNGDLPLRVTYDFPLGRCEGDCDDDPDCEPGLYCFQRDAYEPVPGCLGGSNDPTISDYCIPAGANTRPPLAFSEQFPLGFCVGDCDSDRDCKPGLYCFQRDEYESVPGCSGGNTDGSRVDYCIPPSNAPRHPLRFSTNFPLGRCVGDCDSDHDCESGLICYQRGSYESVPGCSGGSSDGSELQKQRWFPRNKGFKCTTRLTDQHDLLHESLLLFELFHHPRLPLHCFRPCLGVAPRIRINRTIGNGYRYQFSLDHLDLVQLPPDRSIPYRHCHLVAQNNRRLGAQ
eukprot:scaffold175_cov153-Cylindrotheca_fusiformis.AAC.7